MTDRRAVSRRRDTFLDFYRFHLKHRAHPGGVYYLIPGLRDRLGWDDEQTLWFCFINGNTQNPVTSLILHRRGDRPERAEAMLEFWRAARRRLAWDTDRRYHRTRLDASVRGYLAMTGGRQAEFWRDRSWREVWAAARDVPTFGRLSAWSYAEYLHIAGFAPDADDMMLGDMSGSRSHRNGLCLVTGRDDMVWHRDNPAFTGPGCYTADVLADLGGEAEALLADAGPGATRLTLESALCTYKSWHRPNRRYPNVYNDMLHDRIRAAEAAWPGEDLDVLWRLRAESLPERLRLEDNPGDPGVHPIKQNHYLLTGEPVVMYAGTPQESQFDRDVAAAAFGRFR